MSRKEVRKKTHVQSDPLHLYPEPRGDPHSKRRHGKEPVATGDAYPYRQLLQVHRLHGRITAVISEESGFGMSMSESRCRW